MIHVGALITPYVDGELTPARTAQVREHLAVCLECRGAFAAEQAARRRTRCAAFGVQASPELTARLLALPAGAGAPDERRPARRSPFLLGGSLALVGLLVLTLWVVGTERPQQSPSALLAAASASSQAHNAALSAVGDDWALPGDAVVHSRGLIGEGQTETLDLVIETSAGTVRVLERVGVLDDSRLATMSVVQIGGHTAYRTDGWYVLEAGTCVVAVSGDSDAAVEAVIAQLPDPADGGVLERLSEGWSALVG